jgi:hypothetical protein
VKQHNTGLSTSHKTQRYVVGFRLTKRDCRGVGCQLDKVERVFRVPSLWLSVVWCEKHSFSDLAAALAHLPTIFFCAGLPFTSSQSSIFSFSQENTLERLIGQHEEVHCLNHRFYLYYSILLSLSGGFIQRQKDHCKHPAATTPRPRRRHTQEELLCLDYRPCP